MGEGQGWQWIHFGGQASKISRWAGQAVCDRGVNADSGSMQTLQRDGVLLAESERDAGAGDLEEDRDASG